MPRADLRAAVALAALTVLAVPAPAASAAATATAVAPAPGADLAVPVDVVVRVGRQPLDPRPAAVDVSFISGGTTTGPLALTCVEPGGCDGFGSGGGDAWGGVTFDPSSQVCNGVVRVMVSIDGADPVEVATAVLAVPAAAPADLAATTAGSDVTLRWTPVTARDATLTLQRRAVGTETWRTVLTLPTGVGTATDRPGAGAWEHRLATRRGDGRVDGEPAEACTDTEPDTEAASASVFSEVGGTSQPGDPSAPGGQGPSDPASPPADGSAGTGSGDGTAVAPPPPATRSTDASTNVSVSAPAQPGEAPIVDEGFEPTLDYTDADGVRLSGGADGELDAADGEGSLLARLASALGGWDSLRVVGLGVLLMGGAGALRRWRLTGDED